MKTRHLISAGLLALLTVSSSQADIGYQFVPVGNVGNENDTATGSLYGGVGYAYSIGTYDVTLNQYTTFLNAVAATDPYALYNTSMATNLNIAGISRTGSSGSYAYAVIGSGLRPVTYVSWFDAARFSNWLQNGQPTGVVESPTAATELGAYTLSGATSGIITKNGGAVDWIPTESEWYKAAYYDPSIAGVNKYWTYATRSNTAPGNVVGSGSDRANYYTDQGTNVYAVTQSGSYSGSQNYLTDVGVFGASSASAYGTSDQNGDVYQWNDAVINSSRGLRGGDWSLSTANLQASSRFSSDPTSEDGGIGFRLATVPEPSVAVSVIFAGGLLLARRKRPSAL